ncbi:MAG: DUF1292 domain-containing protein [Clostridia bacterium]|jgi:uncharacterized protein YrzB (UPF0473 family)|nr:DUF1292 domain-containing protein [Clostridia bacterium]MBQ4448086.1 DUF1292 domain-containing protein [Clostridia bacterium]MBR3487471.1 DUF1292 domain-containing protein [Clostridia bacterium]
MEHDLTDNKIITLVNDKNEETDFMHIVTFMYEDDRYMALIPIDAEDVEDEEFDEDEEVEVVFARIVKANGEDALEPVENEVLCDELFEVFNSILEEETEGVEDEEDE